MSVHDAITHSSEAMLNVEALRCILSDLILLIFAVAIAT